MAWFKVDKNYAVTSGGPKSNPEVGMEWIKQNNITTWTDFSLSEADIPRILLTGRYVEHRRDFDNPKYNDMPSWLDHARLYKQKQTGRCFLVVHNYDKGTPHKQLRDWCREYHLLCFKSKKSWYGYGTTTYVIMPKDSELLKKFKA